MRAHPESTREAVILLHGLGRTRRAMVPLAAALRKAGYAVVNFGYPSTKRPVAELAADAIPEALRAAEALLAPSATAGRRIHFVTHSLGGILVRLYLSQHRIPALGRVVMLAPPNQGSEVADRLRRHPLYRAAVGPSGLELGTDPGSVPLRLPAVDFELGVIAGDRSADPWFSHWIEGADDGKVSTARTRVAGMRDFLVVHCPHPFIMRHREAIEQTVHFLRHGAFRSPS